MNKVVLFFILILILILSNDFFGYKENNTNVTFIHIPKNAGSSIEYTGYKNGYRWGKYYFYNFKIVYIVDKLVIFFKTNYTSALPFGIPLVPRFLKPIHHIPINYKKSKKLINNKVSFMVVRNPYNKILSNYKFFYKEKKIDINEFVKNNILGLKNNNKTKEYTNYFFIPQHEYLLHNTEVLKFENLHTDFKEFCKRHNLKDMELSKINVSNNKNVANIKGLNAETLKLINEFYSKDFELFGYKKINPN